MPPGGWPAAGRPRRPGRGGAVLRAPPTPATGGPPGGWPICWPAAATWTGCAPGPTPATGRRRRLADLLAGRGDLDGAAQILRAPADAGDRTPPGGWPSCWPSAATWTRLRARADAGDGNAAERLAELLAGRGDLDALRGRADAGDGTPPRLAELLADRGDLDGLRARADAGDVPPPCGWPNCWPTAATWTGPRRSCGPAPTPATDAAARLADCWPSAATWTGLRRLRPRRRQRRACRRRLADLLADRGDLDGLRARADAGDGHAAARLADLLADRGDLDGLRARADAGDVTAAAAGRSAGRPAD